VLRASEWFSLAATRTSPFLRLIRSAHFRCSRAAGTLCRLHSATGEIMKIQLSAIGARSCIAEAVMVLPAQAAEPTPAATKVASRTTWVYPLIPKFGGVHPRPDADDQPDPRSSST
jgi:hypothetical protein